MSEFRKLFTSESVNCGHPDKACDAISDAILDACLAQDPDSRVACETMVKDDFVVLAGEITTKAIINVEEIAKETIKDIGYEYVPRVLNLLQKQSPDIALGTNDDVGGAGDQGIMFGYANNETSEYMPLAISIAHRLMELADNTRRNGAFTWAKADMKSQVTIDYSDEKPRIDTILMSVQHDADYDEAEFKRYIKESIMDPVSFEYGLNQDYKVLINPTGRFVIGGPEGDSGLTGRKIIVDTYGGYAPHGGGAFSGKDPSKVDRSAAYVSRYLAKNIVAAGLADSALVQLSYAIGVAQPISISLELTGAKEDTWEFKEKIIKTIYENVDLSPKGIKDRFELKRPIYSLFDRHGHFGHSTATAKDGSIVECPWERLDLVDTFKSLI